MFDQSFQLRRGTAPLRVGHVDEFRRRPCSDFDHAKLAAAKRIPDDECRQERQAKPCRHRITHDVAVVGVQRSFGPDDSGIVPLCLPGETPVGNAAVLVEDATMAREFRKR